MKQVRQQVRQQARQQQQQQPLTQQQQNRLDREYIERGMIYLGGFLHPDEIKKSMPAHLRKWDKKGDKRDFEIKKLTYLLKKTIQRGWWLKSGLD